MTALMRRTLEQAMFAAGCVLALYVSYKQLEPVVESYRIIPTILSAQTNVLDHACYDADCVRCIDELNRTPPGLVLTAGSSMRRGLDLEAFKADFSFPVVDCMRNDSRVDTYRLFFSHVNPLERGDTIFHAYNSWGINSAGTWRDASTASFFARGDGYSAARQNPGFWDTAQQVRLYINIFLTRRVTESLTTWRWREAARVPSYIKMGGPYWPLTRSEHIRRRVDLMRRWFNLSPYVRTFVLDMEQLRPRAEIEARHRAFFETLSPARKFVFVRAPEMTEVFPAELRAVVAQSEELLREIASTSPDNRYVDIDYTSCGVASEDFWSDSAMVFDIGHAQPPADAKITSCVADALKRIDIETFVRGQ